MDSWIVVKNNMSFLCPPSKFKISIVIQITSKIELRRQLKFVIGEKQKTYHTTFIYDLHSQSYKNKTSIFN